MEMTPNRNATPKPEDSTKLTPTESAYKPTLTRYDDVFFEGLAQLDEAGR